MKLNVEKFMQNLRNKNVIVPDYTQTEWGHFLSHGEVLNPVFNDLPIWDDNKVATLSDILVHAFAEALELEQK